MSRKIKSCQLFLYLDNFKCACTVSIRCGRRSRGLSSLLKYHRRRKITSIPYNISNASIRHEASRQFLRSNHTRVRTVPALASRFKIVEHDSTQVLCDLCHCVLRLESGMGKPNYWSICVCDCQICNVYPSVIFFHLINSSLSDWDKYLKETC